MENKQKLNDEKISRILNDSKKVTQIIQSGIKDALIMHKKIGNPVCEWNEHEKKIVWIQPEKIPIETKK